MATMEQQATIDKIVRRVAQRKIGMFGAFKDIDKEDLFSEASMAVRKAFANYDEAKAGLSTWVYRVASNTMIDMLRARTRTGERETRVVEMRCDTILPPEDAPDPEADREERWRLPLTEFAAATYRKNIFIVPKKRPGRGPQFFSPVLGATIVDLKARLNTSYRGMAMAIDDSPELQKSLRIQRIPNFKTIQRMCVKCRGRSANKRGIRARIDTKGLDMAKTGVIETEEVCGETVAAKAFGISQPTLAQKRREGKLPTGLWKKNAITGRTEYIVSKIREMVGVQA